MKLVISQIKEGRRDLAAINHLLAGGSMRVAVAILSPLWGAKAGYKALARVQRNIRADRHPTA